MGSLSGADASSRVKSNETIRSELQVSIFLGLDQNQFAWCSSCSNSLCPQSELEIIPVTFKKDDAMIKRPALFFLPLRISSATKQAGVYCPHVHVQTHKVVSVYPSMRARASFTNN